MVVGDLPITNDQIDQAVDAQRAQFSQYMQGRPLSPDMELGIYGRVIGGMLKEAAAPGLMQAKGLPMDDNSLMKVLQSDIKDGVERARQDLISQGKLKANATDAEFKEAFKKAQGKDLDQLLNDNQERIRKGLADRSQRPEILAQLAPIALRQDAVSKLKLTDQDVQNFYTNFTVKKIHFKSLVPGKTVEERAAAAEKALAGGMTFEQAANKFSEDLPMGGKKPADQTDIVTGAQFAESPDLKVLATLKPGAVTAPIKISDGEAIYKLVSEKVDLPKDYAANKEKYRKDVTNQMVAGPLDKELTDYSQKPNIVSFKMPGYKAVYDYAALVAKPGGNQTAQYQAIYDTADKAVKAAGPDARPALLVRYAAIDKLVSEGGPNVDKLRASEIEAINGVLDRTESADLRFKLVDLYRESKDYEKAVDQLIQVARNNTPDQSGMPINQQVGDLMSKMLAAKQITPDQQKQIEDAQREWMKLMTDTMVQEQEVKKAQEEEAKKAAEAAKKAAPVKGPVTIPAPGAAPVSPGSPAPSASVPGAKVPAPAAPAAGGSPAGGAPAGAPKK